DLPDLDWLSDMDVDNRQMTIAGGNAVAVIDLDKVAIAAVPAGKTDYSVRRGANRIAGLAAQVKPRVHCRRVHKWIYSDAETRGRVDRAGNRATHGPAADGADQPVELSARDIDPVDLAIEGARIGGRTRRNERSANPIGCTHACDLVGVKADAGEHASN